MTYPFVTIIVLNWNGKVDTLECLESLKYLEYPEYETVVVDNGSSDNSILEINKNYPRIKIIKNKTNMGFVEGNNIAIRYAINNKSDYVLLLNNDTVVDPDLLKKLIDVVIKNPDVGFVGPSIYYYNFNGRKDVINFAGGKLNMWIGKAYNLQNIDLSENNFKQVDFVQGSCLLAKSEMISKIGLLDSIYFAYWEEVDWCVRGYNQGYRSVYVKDAKIWHKIAASNINNKNVYYMARNRFIFMKKNAKYVQYFTFILYFVVVDFILSAINYLLIYKNLQMYKMFIQGTIDGIRTPIKNPSADII